MPETTRIEMNRPRGVVGTLLVAVTTLAMTAIAAPANAQLTPDRLYYGVDRPAPMTVNVPADAVGDAKIKLMAPDGGVLSEASVTPGAVDLAAVFAGFWSKSPLPGVRYAQLAVGESEIGPAVVLQPMISPRYTRQLDRFAQPAFPPVDPRAPFTGFRAYVDKHIVLETSKGAITIKLRPDQAPNSAWNFRHLVEGGYYTDVIFHRVVEKHPNGHGFVIQVGDPTGRGSGGPGYFIDLEPSELQHDFGVVSMARSPAGPNTNGSQVFICLSRQGTQSLDGGYTSFAEVVDGAQVMREIASTPVDGRDRPSDPPAIKRATLVPAPPRSQSPARVSATPEPQPR